VKARRLAIAALVLGLFVALAGCRPSPGTAELAVHFLDVGQGDAILVRTPAGRHLLVDTGPDPERLLAKLGQLGIGRLEVLVLTHPHHDHIGAAAAVLMRLPVDVVYQSGRIHTSRTYEKLLETLEPLVEGQRTRLLVARAGDRIEIDPELRVEILHPPDDDPRRSLNDSSVVLRLSYGQVAFLLMGDAEAEAEEEILASGAEVAAQVLKVGHHGSRSSSTVAFLTRVGPEVAVIMCGSNPYGHPHDEVMDRLAQLGAAVYVTVHSGTVTVRSDGRGYRVTTER